MTVGQMYYRGYSWSAIRSNDPRVSGPPDHTPLNRHEGYEVLYFVEMFCQLNKLVTMDDQLKVERMIRLAPVNVRSQVEVKRWIEENWKML